MAARVATDEEVIAALRKHGGNKSRAAKEVGLHVRTLQRRIPRLARKGWSPDHDMTKTVPDGFHVKGTSTLYDEDGKPRLQWVKSNIDHERQAELQQAAIQALQEEVKGLWTPFKAPKGTLEHELSAYLIGDAHFGLYAWAEEAGEDFDTAIASKDLRAAIDRLVDNAPPSATGYLVDVGDFLHADSRVNATPSGGNPLDVDSRFPKVVRIAVQALRYCIGRMLTKHKRVEVFITPGNHNPNSAGWLAMVLSAYFERDKRVIVECSPGKYYYRRFGDCLIGITHGDKTKMADLPSIMATDRARDWGETKFRYWWTGHIHHTRHQEYRGCFVESFNTLAASDAWHHESGYRSARQMQRIDLDMRQGIVGRRLCGIGMLKVA